MWHFTPAKYAPPNTSYTEWINEHNSTSAPANITYIGGSTGTTYSLLTTSFMSLDVTSRLMISTIFFLMAFTWRIKMSYTLYSVPCTDKTKLIVILTALNSDQKETRSIMVLTGAKTIFSIHRNFSEIGILHLQKHSSVHSHFCARQSASIMSWASLEYVAQV